MVDRPLIVLASERDIPARRLVERWSGHDAHLLTPAHLSVTGWRYRVGDVGSSLVPLDGRMIRADDIGGVVTRLAHVSEDDLPHIFPEDRSYVALEMRAFLLSYMSELPCPVVNRPTVSSLNGPAWRHEQWAFAASRLGMPVTPLRRTVTNNRAGGRVDVARRPSPPASTVIATVVGSRIVGESPSWARDRARRLADAAGVDLLSAAFAGPDHASPFVYASPWPDVGLADVADALLEWVRNPREMHRAPRVPR